MNTTAVRIHGVKDLRVDRFELPEPAEDEILVKVITDSLCLSTYKVAQKGSAHKKLPDNLDKTPIIMGHEFCGIIEWVGEKWKDKYKVGDRFVAQPNLGRADTYSLGYSFPYVGGEATYSLVMNEAIEKGCLIPYHGASFFEGAMAEPLSCVVAGLKANFHLRDRNDYDHVYGIKQGGSMAILGGTGPMGSLMIDLAIHGERRPSLLVVTGRTQSKLDYLKKLYTVEDAKANGVTLIYEDCGKEVEFSSRLRGHVEGDKGFDDVFAMVAEPSLVTEAEKLLGWDGCLNFFAGPIDAGFTAPVNFYNIHYNATHYVGTSGSNMEDMREAVKLIENRTVDVGKIATHILGIDQVPETILNLPSIPGGKKICYSGKRFPITEVKDLCEGKASEDQFSYMEGLRDIIRKNDGLWSAEAEQYFLKNAEDI